MATETELEHRGRRLAQILRTLVEDYPTADPDVTPTVRLTLTRQGRELDIVEIPPDDLTHLTEMIRAELATYRNAHTGQSGTCGHCGGTGQARTATGDTDSS